jgi:hypothetical protein
MFGHSSKRVGGITFHRFYIMGRVFNVTFSKSTRSILAA